LFRANLFCARQSHERLPAVSCLPSAVLLALACPGVFRKGKPFLFQRCPADGEGHRLATANPWPGRLLRRDSQLTKHSDFFRLLPRAFAQKRSLSGSRPIWPADRPSLSVFARAQPRLSRLCFLLLRLCPVLRS